MTRSVRYAAIIPIVMLGILLSISGQDNNLDLNQIDLESVNFANARLSIAGPGAFLIRNVELDNTRYSVIFRETEGVWTVAELIPESESPLLPPNVILDFATVSITPDGLLIENIIIDGESYSTRLIVSSEAIATPGTLSAAKLTGAALSRIGSDAGLFTESEISALSAGQTALLERNTDLLAQVGDLNSRLEAALSQNELLSSQLAQLSTEKEALDEEIVGLQQQLAELDRAETGTNPTENAGDSADIPELTLRIGELLADINRLEGRIISLENSIDNSRESLAADSATISGNETGETETNSSTGVTSAPDGSAPALAIEYLEQIKTLERTITELRIENARLSAERGQIEQEIRRQLFEQGYIAIVSGELTEQLHEGFMSGNGQIGSWEIQSGSISQNNPEEFFAKFELPVIQNNEPTLYRFDTRSQGSGWVGAGLHIFAQGSELRGYGYGESLLVWITRDPGTYGNNQTYLELYRSSDDINMARVMSAAITENISEWLDIAVLYEPEQEYLTIAVNAEEKIRYKTWFGIESGVSTALRTLDLGQFRNLEVLTSP